MDKYAVAMYNQTCNDSGSINENKRGGSLWGFAYRMLIPVSKEFNNKESYLFIYSWK